MLVKSLSRRRTQELDQFGTFGIYCGAEGNHQARSPEAEAGSKEGGEGLAGCMEVFLKSNSQRKAQQSPQIRLHST